MAKNQIMIYDPKNDGTYIVKTSEGEALVAPVQILAGGDRTAWLGM